MKRAIAREDRRGPGFRAEDSPHEYLAEIAAGRDRQRSAALPGLPGADRVAHSDDVALSDALAMNEHAPIAQDAGGRRLGDRSCTAVPIVSLTATMSRSGRRVWRSNAPYPRHEEAPASPPGLPDSLAREGLRSPSLRRGRDRRRRRPSPSPGGPRPASPWSGPSRRWRRRSGGRTASPSRRPRCPS